MRGLWRLLAPLRPASETMLRSTVVGTLPEAGFESTGRSSRLPVLGTLPEVRFSQRGTFPHAGRGLYRMDRGLYRQGVCRTS